MRNHEEQAKDSNKHCGVCVLCHCAELSLVWFSDSLLGEAQSAWFSQRFSSCLASVGSA